MYKGHGAIVIGSETSGDIRDIAASNIVSRGTDIGIRIKSQRGRGGVIENMRFDNFVIEDAGQGAQGRPAGAIEITGLYTREPAEPLSEKTPVFRNISFSNITILNATQVARIVGLEEQAIHELRFNDVTATGQKGFICDRADDIELHHVRVDVTSGVEYSFAHSQGVVMDGKCLLSRAMTKACRSFS